MNQNQKENQAAQESLRQASIISQLKAIFPHLENEEIISRTLPTSAVACQSIYTAQFQNEDRYYWLIATLPEISDHLFLSFFEEQPRAFYDALAYLDALSETDDSLAAGQLIQTHHSVLSQRGYPQLTLLNFEQIYPTPKLEVAQNPQGYSAHRPRPKNQTQQNQTRFSFEEEPIFLNLVYFLNTENSDLITQHGFKVFYTKLQKNLCGFQELALPTRKKIISDKEPLNRPPRRKK